MRTKAALLAAIVVGVAVALMFRIARARHDDLPAWAVLLGVGVIVALFVLSAVVGRRERSRE